MTNLKRVVISSTIKNDKIIKQQVVYKGNGHSRTKHERVKVHEDNTLSIIDRPKPKSKTAKSI